VVLVKNSYKLTEKETLHFPGAILDCPTIMEYDEDYLVDFCVTRPVVDFISLSNVRKPTDIEYVREVLGPKGAHVKIIAKI